MGTLAAGPMTARYGWRARASTLLVLVMIAAACSASDAGSEVQPDGPPRTSLDTGSGATSATSASTANCAAAKDGVAWREDAAVAMQPILSDGGKSVYAAEYPLPGPTDGLWSQWGQGIALGDGRHLSAVGDHLGVDGNSYFFVYDSASRTLTRFADVLSTVPHQEGAFGYGKVHAPMVQDRCGVIWASTYWGSRRNLAYQNGYDGDRLLAIDAEAATISDKGPVAGELGLPAMTITGDGRTLVLGSVRVESRDPVTGMFTIVDTSTGHTAAQVDDPRQYGFRALGVDPPTGGVLYGIGGGKLASLDPISGEYHDSDVIMPGNWLRAVTRPADDGTIYAASDDQPSLFSISPGGSLEDLGDPGGLTTSLAMTPDGGRLFWMPEAHGKSWESGAKVMALDTVSGEKSEVVALRDPFREELGLLPGGTYSVVYDHGRLILGVNASTLEDDSGFGAVVLVVIEGV